MSAEDEQIVRRALTAFEFRRDLGPLLELVSEDVELRSAIIGGAEANVYRGHDGVRRWAREGEEAFEELALVAEDVRTVGDAVVALGFIHVRGGASGVAFDSPSGWVFGVRDGRIARMHGYLDHDQALEAARAGVE
jgi:ketosteroid isomerase-like protein